MVKSVDNIGFAGINYQWFIGQVPPNQTLDKTDPNGWGDRVKVRIVGIHDKSGTLTPDEQLPWAIVERPTTQGNASRGSTGLTGGEWVRGYFLDPFNQVPVITSVLGRGTFENNVSLEIAQSRKSTEFENVTRYNSFGPYAGQRLGSEKPPLPESAALDSTTKTDVLKAKEVPENKEDIAKNIEKNPPKDRGEDLFDGPTSATSESRRETSPPSSSTERLGSPENPVPNSNANQLLSSLPRQSERIRESQRISGSLTPEQIITAQQSGYRVSTTKSGDTILRDWRLD